MSGRCIAKEHSESNSSLIYQIFHCYYLIQAVTTLILDFNGIGDEGAQCLANVLKSNTVSHALHSYVTLFTAINQYRQLRRWIFISTESALKAHMISRMHYKGTQ
jgi:hypothetical protein